MCKAKIGVVFIKDNFVLECEEKCEVAENLSVGVCVSRCPEKKKEINK